MSKTMGCFVALGVLFVILVISVAIGGGGSDSTSGTLAPTAAPQPAEQDPPAEQPADPPKPAGPVTTFGDGTHVVGSDIASGTYKTAGPEPGIFELCSWSRLKDTTGDSGSIITFGTSQGPATVTIVRSDGAFQTSGCKQWTKTG